MKATMVMLDSLNRHFISAIEREIQQEQDFDLDEDQILAFV